MLGDERTLADLLRSFDQVTADQVRAEAELLFSHAPTLALSGARVPARGIESLLSRGKAELSVCDADLRSDGGRQVTASFVARVRALAAVSQPSRELLRSAKRSTS